ncbi:MAG TPA: DUF1573 domain-containing protein [Gemmataceae bacterium]|jgi:hypothetical protein
MIVLSSDRRGIAIRSLLVVGVLLALASVGGVVAALALRKTPPVGLEPAPDRLEFGEVWEDTQFSWALPITNHSAQDVEIKRFRGTCTCSQIEPKSLVIPAGQTREIHLTFDLLAKQPKEGGSPVHDFEVGISPDMLVEVGEAEKIRWTIRGCVRSAIRCDPPLVDFGRESELAQPLSPRRATIKTFAPLKNLTATCTPPQFDVTVQRHSAEGSDRFDLLVTPRGSLPRGEIHCTIALVPELSDGQRLPAKKIEVTGRVVGDVEASPPIISLGAYPIATSVEETITLRSLTQRPFAVTGVRCEGAGLSVERVRDALRFGSMFQVKQKIRAKGERNDKVIFGVRPEGGKDDEVVVSVSSCGIDSITH